MDSTKKTDSVSENGPKSHASAPEPTPKDSRESTSRTSASPRSTETSSTTRTDQGRSSREPSIREQALGRDDPSLSKNVDPATRFLAMLIDGVVAMALGLVPVVGGIAGAAYFVVRDGLTLDFMNERSLGKHLMGLRVVRLDGQPMDIETSARRNWMWGIGAITAALVYIPIVGWILIPLVALVGLAIGLYEGYRVLTDAEGRRWGDQMAQTKVVK